MLLCFCTETVHRSPADPNDASFLQTAPLPADRDPARGLALVPFHAQSPRRRRNACASWRRCGLQNHSILDSEVRPEDLRQSSRRKLPPSPRWRRDEMVSNIAGERAKVRRARRQLHPNANTLRFHYPAILGMSPGGVTGTTLTGKRIVTVVPASCACEGTMRPPI